MLIFCFVSYSNSYLRSVCLLWKSAFVILSFSRIWILRILGNTQLSLPPSKFHSSEITYKISCMILHITKQSFIEVLIKLDFSDIGMKWCVLCHYYWSFKIWTVEVDDNICHTLVRQNIFSKGVTQFSSHSV